MMVDLMPSNALDSITIQGFKSIASIEKFPLRPVNIVIGANGSGKSNFIGVFEFLHEIRDEGTSDYVKKAGGADRVLHFGSKTTREICIDVSIANVPLTWRLRPTADDELYLNEEQINWRGRQPDDDRVVTTEDDDVLRDERRQKLLDLALDWRIYHFNDTSFSSPMRKTARVDDNRFLRPDGANLPAFLYLLREKHPITYKLIIRTVQLAAPFLDDLLLEPTEINREFIKLEWRHKTSDQTFGVSALSDGTLRFIAVATLFLQPEQYRPSLILVDEPELGLHPYAIELLASLIRQASVTTQVIASTQSALLVDHFDPEDILVADRVHEGTKLKRLETKQWKKWLEDYSLGQLWEKNEIGGNPTSG